MMKNVKTNETEMYNRGYNDGYAVGFSDGCVDNYDAEAKSDSEHYKRGFFNGYSDGFHAGYENTNELIHSHNGSFAFS